MEVNVQTKPSIETNAFEIAKLSLNIMTDGTQCLDPLQKYYAERIHALAVHIVKQLEKDKDNE